MARAWKDTYINKNRTRRVAVSFRELIRTTKLSKIELFRNTISLRFVEDQNAKPCITSSFHHSYLTNDHYIISSWLRGAG